MPPKGQRGGRGGGGGGGGGPGAPGGGGAGRGGARGGGPPPSGGAAPRGRGRGTVRGGPPAAAGGAPQAISIGATSAPGAHIQTVGVRRPGTGRAGRPIQVYTNHFEIAVPDSTIHHYDGVCCLVLLLFFKRLTIP
jgi:eukaryotic translation initiation factor 2C